MILGHVRRRGNLEPGGGSTPYMAYTEMCSSRVQFFTSLSYTKCIILWVCPKGTACMIDLISLMNFACTSSKQKHDGWTWFCSHHCELLINGFETRQSAVCPLYWTGWWNGGCRPKQDMYYRMSQGFKPSANLESREAHTHPKNTQVPPPFPRVDHSRW